VPASDADRLSATFAPVSDRPALLENLFAHAPIGLQICDGEGRSVLVNRAYLELFGAAPPAGYDVLSDEAMEPSVRDALRRALAGETVTIPPVWYDAHKLARTPAAVGRRVATQSTFLPLADGSGRVSHVAVIFEDMTAERVHREQLEEERELLAGLVDQVGDGIAMADARGTLRLVNRAAREAGLRPGMELETLAPASRLAEALSGEPVKDVLHYLGPDGAVQALAAVAVPLLRSDGTKRGVAVTLRDETERERREREAEAAAHFRERFIGILGHDLRLPLTAVGASAAILQRMPDVSEAAKSVAARIAGSTERMGRMIGDVLDFTQARLGAGIPVVRKPCDLHEVARVAVEEARAASSDRRIVVSRAGDTTGSFDPDRIAQLLGNLLQNAIAYGAPDEAIEVVVRGLDGHVQIEVANGGARIPEESARTLFDPFRRGAVGASSGHKGLGLGLFIVQQIARAHQGDARCMSDERRTVFSATFQR
jgi:signal transduction histidine kinase